MFNNIARGENLPQVGIQYEGESKMNTKPLNEASLEHQPVSVSLTREEEIEQIVKSEYRRHRLGDKEVVLFSPSLLTNVADGGKLAFEPQYELKKDVADALRKFSPAERRIIFRVFVQGQSVDLATKGSMKSSSFWHNWLQTKALPYLRNQLKDYQENGKVVLS